MASKVGDADVLKLAGAVFESPSRSGVRYRLEQVIGQGAHGIVYAAECLRPDGSEPVVVKILRPRAVRELAGLAETAIRKEVAALMRLSAREPATPFVVKFLDTGMCRVADARLELPWIAVECVRGGLDGVTLTARVDAAVARTGHAFELARAAKAVRCMTRGLAAIHEVGVIHRDVTPNNVLCSGEGESELFKISDFGLARVTEMSTFGDILLGTPGYSAPEQSFPEKAPVGPYTDVFGIACSVYWLLTGDHFFEVQTVPETFVLVQSAKRRPILDGYSVAPELRARPELAAALDGVLARATRANPLERPSSPLELADLLLPLLAPGSEEAR
jgi:eukaryotic-like serine/threonine-protein kinase